jgi:hypothetical protein
MQFRAAGWFLCVDFIIALLLRLLPEEPPEPRPPQFRPLRPKPNTRAELYEYYRSIGRLDLFFAMYPPRR